MTRYAIYFAPHPDTALWRFGSHVLGYDAATGADSPPPDGLATTAAQWARLTAAPRRYGFHATLKAPFQLAAGTDETRLLAAVADLAGTLAPVMLGALTVAELGRFLALVPAHRSEPLQHLAGAIVEHLEPFRAPLSAADRARRLASPLGARQLAYLDRFGYPYVLDEFRFHMTLTGPVDDPAERTEVRHRLAAAHASLVPREPVIVDAATIYRQADHDQRFRIIARFPLTLGRGP